MPSNAISNSWTTEVSMSSLLVHGPLPCGIGCGHSCKSFGAGRSVTLSPVIVKLHPDRFRGMAQLPQSKKRIRDNCVVRSSNAVLRSWLRRRLSQS